MAPALAAVGAIDAGTAVQIRADLKLAVAVRQPGQENQARLIRKSDLRFYEWSGRTFKYHRAQGHLGFRECSTEHAAKLTEWLAASVCRAERRADRVREELLARCRAEQTEPPSAGRSDRIIRSALYQAEQALTQLVAARLDPAASVRLAQLAAAAANDDAEETTECAGSVSARCRSISVSVPGGSLGTIPARAA